MSATTYEQERTETQKRIDDVVLNRVKRGIRLLEKEHGPDWVDHINLDTLNLRYSSTCVLGQIDGDYHDSIYDRWGDSAYTQAVKHGFSLPEHEANSRWNLLQETWLRVLTPLVRRD